MEQQIKFCTSPDGARIAYSTVGQGAPLVLPTSWISLSHLELLWRDPNFRAWCEKMARHHMVVGYDKRGCGLSDRNRTDFSLDSELQDLESVIGHLKLKRVALLGLCQGAATAVAYAVKYRRRVTHLILYAAYARGSQLGTEEIRTTLISLVRSSWEMGSRMLADGILPGANAATLEAFVRLQSEFCTSEMAAKILEMTWEADMAHLLPTVRVPTLVLHREQDRMVPLQCGKEVAALIPDARFVPLQGNVHLPWFGDTEPMLQAISGFFGDPVSPPAVSLIEPAAGQPIVTTLDKPVAREARSLIAGLDWVTLSRYRVVGNFTTYQEEVRHRLKDVRQKIADGFSRPGHKRENHLIWAAPGSGKTYFVQQLAASLRESVSYHELNLAECSEREFLSGLSQLKDEDKPHLCLVDEIDAKPHEAWPYTALLPYLDAAVAKGRSCVFMLAGSSGSSIDEMKEGIASRPKGVDLLSRVPAWNEYEIPP